MNVSVDLARTLLSNVRSVVSQVADLSYQKRVWLGDVPNERSSFVEIYYAIEGADIDAIRSHRKGLGCTDQEWELILRFLVRFLMYYSETNDVYAQEEIILDPHWLTVVAAAKDALEAQPR